MAIDHKKLKDIYIPDFGIIAKEYKVTVKCDDWEIFFKIQSVDALKKLYDATLIDEYYEMAEIIKNEIDQR